ncbi:MAG: MFS transporter [Haloechinothrix sp.]
MTRTGTALRVESPSPLRNRAFVGLLLGSAGLFFGFSLLVSVVPLWVVEQGDGEFAAGASTGVFMASTVVAQFLMPGLVRRFGYRFMSIVGAILLGLPAVFLLVSLTWQPVLAIALVRGLGFGIVTVCGSALIAELVPAGSLGRGSGLYGLAVGLPLLIGLPASTWVAQNVGFGPVFLAGAALPLLAIAPLLVLPKGESGAASADRGVFAAAIGVWRPWLVMFSGSIAFGAMVTFLPLVFAASPVAAASALLLMSATGLGGRWLAGVWGDRSALTGRLLLMGLIVTALGLTGFAVVADLDGTAALVLGVTCVAVYGAGFGVVQNDSLVLMFNRASAARASVAWNVAFDAGQGAGAVAVGALVSGTSYSIAFGCLALFAFALLAVAWRARR